MSQRNLRQKPRISYYEPEEPNLDEYVFCEKCGDYVYEYCAIHGPLLVIPDDKVPAKPNVPSYVPRAALTIPHVFLHITYSIIPDAGLGVFTSRALPSGVRFGPYQGQRTDVVNSTYCWQIYDKNRKPLYCIDAADANRSNWMRYVNCARHWKEQNLVAYQYQGELYYRTIKIIPRYTELMVFYGSEFACELDVDLGRYNSPTGYAQKFGAPVAKKRKPNDDNTKTKTQRDEVQTGNSEMTNTNVSKSAQVAIKDITTGMQNGQVILTTASEQVKENYPLSKTSITKARKTKNKAANKNSEINKTNDVMLTENYEESKAVQNKQDSTCIVSSNSPSIEKQKSRNNEVKDLDKVEVKTNLAGQINVHDLYIYCDTCNKRCATKQELQSHLRFHDRNRKYACEVCKLRYTSFSSLNTHSNIHKNTKSYECTICRKSFGIKSSLKRHMRIHTGVKPYTCDICNANFHVNSHLKVHMRIHTGEKPYTCDICNAKFNQNSSLKVHMRIHTGEKPYTCDICHENFNQNSHLKYHNRSTHTGEKPYTCDICNANFHVISHLKVHMRIHTGEKPYTCDICNAKFNQNSSLKDHMRIHTGEKPYTCEICETKFTSSTSLKNHLMKTHLGNKNNEK